MNDDPLQVRVELGERSYEILIGTKTLSQVGARVVDCCGARHAIVITDIHVQDPYAAAVAEHLSDAGVDVEVLAVPAGETSKSVTALSALWLELLEAGADRRTVVIALGGGVVGDLAGFVAASFARGLRFIQIPTTLLAQVDSSVGGKVGINLPHAKNMVGHFWQPHLVLIDTEVLKTLPDREYRAGLAEVVKYGMIQDEAFLAYLEDSVAAIQAREDLALREIVARCCRLKADVVEADEREESGLRAILNYGHTFAHALEAVTEYERLLHGEAVSIGMDCAARLAVLLERIPTAVVDRQRALLEAIGLPVELPDVDMDAVLERMRHDKKVEHGQLRFVLPTRVGHVELVDGVDEFLVRETLG